LRVFLTWASEDAWAIFDCAWSLLNNFGAGIAVGHGSAELYFALLLGSGEFCLSANAAGNYSIISI